MTVTINGTTGITSPEVVLDNAAADGGQVVLKSSGYSNWNWDNYSGRLRAYYNATEYFTIDTSGNVGIGTSSPTALLQVGNGGTAASTNTEIKINANNGSGSGGFLRGNRNSSDSWLIGDLNVIAGGSNTGLVNYVYGANPYVVYTNGSERARIDSSGSLLVGKTSTSDTVVGVQVSYAGSISQTNAASTNATVVNAIYSTGASAYRFYVGMGGTVYATSTTISSLSDIRFKENVRDLDAGLAEVMALKPRLYDWKEGKGADIKNARGFIAQEFEQVFPDLIDEWRDPAPEGEEPYKSVRQDLIPVLVKAIQELNAKVDSLQGTVTTQAAKIEALEAKNA